MNKSQKIYFDETTRDNAHVIVKLEQNTDTLEFLSMNVKTTDVYRDFNSDYGVLVGKVIANGGVGVENAKISIFIPVEDDDLNVGYIRNIYPYKTPRDKNMDGKRYNLLPRVSKVDPQTGFVKPKQAFGSFPIKEELITNQSYLDIYKKYYKYSAVTNSAGDYMIFGVPIGTQTTHLSVDITDIGKYSMTPASMVTNLGYSPNLFTENGTRIKPSNDLNDLPHIETQEITVDIIPFWGDSENFEIGITRQDFRIRSVLNNTFTLFGSVFTDSVDAMWGEEVTLEYYGSAKIRELFRASNPSEDLLGMDKKRIAKVTEKIYYYPDEISDLDIENNLLITDQMRVLDPSEYSVYKRDGDFVFIVNCNRKKVITDDLNNEIPVPQGSSSGIYTEFRGFVTLEITYEDAPYTGEADIGSGTKLTAFRYRLKFPQYSTKGNTFNRGELLGGSLNWRKQDYIFKGGKLYSFAKFHPTVHNAGGTNNNNQFPTDRGYFAFDHINLISGDLNWTVGAISSRNNPSNASKEFPSNINDGSFYGNWMNLSIYLGQYSRVYKNSDEINRVIVNTAFASQLDNDETNNFFTEDNNQKFVGNEYNTKWFARSDLNWTDIVEVPELDIKLMSEIPTKGFTGETYGLTGKYRNATYIPNSKWITPCPWGVGRGNGTYLYKGLNEANCISYLIELGIV